MLARLSEDTVRALLAEKNWEPIEGWEYVNNVTPIPGRCLVEGCGYEGPGTNYNHLQQGRGACKECSNRNQKLSEETVWALLAEKNWEPIEGWKYVNANTPIPGRCLVEGCGYEGPGPRYSDLKNGCGACKRCSGREKLSNETVRAILAEKDWEPVEGWEYVDVKTPIPGRCLVEGCGYEGPGPRYGYLKRGGRACAECANRERTTPEEDVRALLAGKDWEPVEGWEYVNSTTPVPGKCLICGYESGPDEGPRYGNLKLADLIACPSCSQGGGYDSSKPGVFYRFTFVEHGDRFQVYGITNNWNRRKKDYERELRRKTWKMSDVQTLYFEDGKIPQQIEADFNKIRTPLLGEVLPSQSEIRGTAKESFSLSPENWELLTIFEAHWIEAKGRAD